MKKLIKQIVTKEAFRPGFIGLFTNPFYFSRKGLYDNISKLSGSLTGKILDVGCGTKPYELLFPPGSCTGLEIATAGTKKNFRADYFYDGKIFPFETGSFDSVLCNEVFEHISNPDDFLFEISRVLKPGGKALFTVPFVWDEHEQPNDFFRYTSFGIQNIFQNNGFEILEFKKSVADIRVIFQLANCFLVKITAFIRKGFWSSLFTNIFTISLFNITGQLLYHLLPRNYDLYLDNILLVSSKRLENDINRMN